MKPTNRIAVALGLQNTASTLAVLNEVSGYVGLAEVRLDLMDEYDLEQIITCSPCPLIITCRPRREGGRYDGSERDRLAILAQASELNCAYIDVEWDSVDGFQKRGATTKLIVSRHYHDSVVTDAREQYERMRTQADAVKLVGFAEWVSDALPMLEMLAEAETPVIAIAMGAAGLVTRMLAPCFDACLLTYGAANGDLATAPGQISVQEMVDRFALDRVSASTRIRILLYGDTKDAPAVQRQGGGSATLLSLPLYVRRTEWETVAQRLQALSPRITVARFN